MILIRKTLDNAVDNVLLSDAVFLTTDNLNDLREYSLLVLLTGDAL